METAHLLRSPKNAQRLLKAMRRAQQHTGVGQIDNLQRVANPLVEAGRRFGLRG